MLPVSAIDAKRLALIFLCIIAIVPVIAQYKVVDSKSSIKFRIKNFGINVNGTFSGLEGNISFDPKHAQETTVKVSMDAGTVNTDNDLRDSHLKKETYFNIIQYPRIYFESTKIANAANNGMFLLFGKLTIKNHSKEISFPFTAEPSGDGYLFKGVFSVNRKDFDVGGTSIIADNAEVSMTVFANK